MDETSPLLQAVKSPALNAQPNHSIDEVSCAQFTALRPGDPPVNAACESRQASVALHDSIDTAEARQRLGFIFPALAIGIFLSAADQTLVVSSYGRIGSDLNALEKVSWLATSYLMSTTAFQPLYGKLSDILGRKTCLLFAYTVFGLGTCVCGLAPNMNGLIAARALTGVGSGGITTMVSIVLNNLVSIEDRGLWQGFVNLVWACGAGIGAPLGGILTEKIGWRWAFIGQAPLCAVSVITVAVMLRETMQLSDDSRRTRLARIDFPGSITLVSGLASLLLFFDCLTSSEPRDNMLYLWASTTVLSFAGFLIIELRFARDPLIPWRLFFGVELLPAYLCNMLGNMSWFGVMFYLPLLYQAVARLNVMDASLLLLPGIIASILGGLGSGLAMKYWARVNYLHLAIGSYILTMLGCILVATLAGNSGLIGPGNHNLIFAGLSLALVVGGLGNGGGMTSSLVAVIARAKEEDQAIATANSFLYRSLGASMGLAIMTVVFQRVLGYDLISRCGMDGDPSVDPQEILDGIRISLEYLAELPAEVRALATMSYALACQSVFILCAALALSAAITATFLRKNKLMKGGDETTS